MNSLKVILWNHEIGRLVWQPATRRTYFMYNAEESANIPDISPLLAPIAKRNLSLPIYGDDRPLYQGLPPFIADSLPDSWGNTLFDKWVTDNKIPGHRLTPLYKLMFIGKRGMGALEFEPAAEDLELSRKIDIKSLYDLSLQVLEQRDKETIDPQQELTLQALLAVGTSAGGRQMKAILAINSETGEIRSGQTADNDSDKHYILKFGDSSMPIAEIEMAYYAMATEAGIEMEESRLINIEGINHFLTRRFDRRDGKKLLTQTLAAIFPDARSYDDLIAVGRELRLCEREMSQIFRRMAFNIMANNTDDHNKNFSFTLDCDGKWHLAPAYDITFIFNSYGTGANRDHRFSVFGKTTDITQSDLLEFARRYDIKDAKSIINDISLIIRNFPQYAQIYGIDAPWRDIIWKELRNAPLNPPTRREISDSQGDLTISINTKGYYDLCAIIDGNRRRRVIRPSMPEYALLKTFDIFNLTNAQKKDIIKSIFEL